MFLGDSIVKMEHEHINDVYHIECQLDYQGWTRKHFIDCLHGNYENEILKHRAQLIGYLITQWVADECHLLNICVAPAHQQNGYGQRLMDYLISQCHAREVSVIFLEVRESNNRAQHFYRKSGFYEIGVRKNYYPSGRGRETAVLMARYFDS